MPTPVDIRAPWRKSTKSNNTGGECVEVAVDPAVVGVRDTKDRGGPMLVFGGGDWSAFVGDVKAGRLSG